MQVSKKELTVAKMANGKAEQFYEQNDKNAQWIDTKNAANDEGIEQRSAGGSRFLAFKRKQENETGVNKKDEDAEMADACLSPSPATSGDSADADISGIGRHFLQTPFNYPSYGYIVT